MSLHARRRVTVSQGTMTFSSESSPSAFEWKFSQVFGDRNPGEDVQDMDAISAIDFEKSGDHLAVGDRGGRVVIFERKPGKDVKEHKLKKVKIMDLNPLASLESALLAERSYIDAQNKSSFPNGYCSESREKMDSNRLSSHVSHARVANIGDDAPASARCRKVYAHAHDFNINSISKRGLYFNSISKSDGETFVSVDDLRINLWNLEVSNQCFNIIDMKPSDMDDLTEVITSAEFHPLHCNTLAYSSSRGFIRLVDMRQSALCDHRARILHDGDSHGHKTFFTEIIASISDMKFATDGRHILSRDYMTLKVPNYLTIKVF